MEFKGMGDGSDEISLNNQTAPPLSVEHLQAAREMLSKPWALPGHPIIRVLPAWFYKALRSLAAARGIRIEAAYLRVEEATERELTGRSGGQ